MSWTRPDSETAGRSDAAGRAVLRGRLTAAGQDPAKAGPVEPPRSFHQIVDRDRRDRHAD